MKLLDLIKSVRLLSMDIAHEDGFDVYAYIEELDINTFTAYGLEYYKKALNATVVEINGSCGSMIIVGDVDPDDMNELFADLAGFCSSTHYDLCFKGGDMQ